MHFQNIFTTLYIRQVDRYLAVKTAGAEQGGVQNIRPVGGGKNDDTFVGIKTVHFHQQLVQCLFPFVMPAAQAGPALTAYGVNFINKNNTRGMLFGVVKQIAHP